MQRDVAHRAAGLLSVALALLLVLTSCASAPNGAADSGASADPPDGTDSFCDLWVDMTSRMEESEGMDQAGLEDFLELRDSVSDQLPDDLTEQWNAIIEGQDPMVEILYAINFDWEALNEEMVSSAFGSPEAAEAAEAAQQTAVSQIDRWVVRNCGERQGDALSFCALWADIFVTQLGFHPDPNMDPESEEAQNRFVDLVARADAVAPADVRDRWDPIVGYHLTWHNLLLTVDFNEDLISDDLLTDAFGSPEAAAASAAAAESSVAAVETWSQTGCGDFCARSRELTDRIGEFAERLDRRAGDTYGYATAERSLAHADALMPDELLVYWEPVSAELNDWIGWWASHDYDSRQLESAEAQAEAIEIYRQADYQSIGPDENDPQGSRKRIAEIEAWRRGEADLGRGVAEMVGQLSSAPPFERPGFMAAANEIFNWPAQNCLVGSTGPGLVEVRFGEVTGAAGDRLVLMIGPEGSTAADLAIPEQFLGGLCAEIDRDPWGFSIHGEEQEREYWGQPLQQLTGDDPDEREKVPLCESLRDHATLDPGRYTMVAATYEGAAPAPQIDVQPTRCLTLDVTVSGDTLIDLPELPPCELAPPPAEAGQWGYVEPVATSTPGAGSLKVRIPTQLAPDTNEFSGGGRYQLYAIALPEGTTLNEIGREQVFPPAAGCVFLWSDRDFPREREIRPVEVPLGPLSRSGLSSCFSPDWLNGAAPIDGAPAGEPAADSSLPLTVLAPGTYTIYVRGFWDGIGHEGFCATFDATVDGDTVVDVPVDLSELERCS